MDTPVLSELTIRKDPVAQFQNWFADAAIEPEHNAMVLATASAGDVPSARVVLLKQFDSTGFVFYTNYEGRKARELAENPLAAAVFHWPMLGRQVRIEGVVEKVSAEQSAAYFHSRPRESQLGSMASAQSAEISDRSTLDDRVTELRTLFEGKEIPLPAHWGGFRIVPNAFEFWHQGSEGRLHDRFLYRKNEEGVWKIVRLSP